jgi:hypothetical protein
MRLSWRGSTVLDSASDHFCILHAFAYNVKRALGGIFGSQKRGSFLLSRLKGQVKKEIQGKTRRKKSRR